MELITARVPVQTVINEVYKLFVNPIDHRLLPGVTVDHFGFVVTNDQFLAQFENFQSKLLQSARTLMLPRGGFISIGNQTASSNLTWDGARLPYLALVGCETMGIISGGGFIVLHAPDLHPVISHMIYNNLPFNEDELYGQKCLSFNLGGGGYCSNANVCRVFVLNTSVADVTSHLHPWY